MCATSLRLSAGYRVISRTSVCLIPCRPAPAHLPHAARERIEALLDLRRQRNQTHSRVTKDDGLHCQLHRRSSVIVKPGAVAGSVIIVIIVVVVVILVVVPVIIVTVVIIVAVPEEPATREARGCRKSKQDLTCRAAKASEVSSILPLL